MFCMAAFKYFPNNRELLAPNKKPLKLGETNTSGRHIDQYLSRYGSDYLYNSSFTSDMVTELQNVYGSILTTEDFRNYTAQVRDVLNSQFSGFKVLVASPPSSGAVVALVLNILEGKLHWCSLLIYLNLGNCDVCLMFLHQGTTSPAKISEG